MGSTTKQSLAAIVTVLQSHATNLRRLGVTHLAIFGSRARGDHRPDSDLDVLIDYDSAGRFSLYDFVGVENFIADLTSLRVHLATRGNFPAVRLERVLRDAVTVF